MYSSDSDEEEILVIDEETPEIETTVPEEALRVMVPSNRWKYHDYVNPTQRDSKPREAGLYSHALDQEILKDKMNVSKEKLTHILNAIIHFDDERPSSYISTPPTGDPREPKDVGSSVQHTVVNSFRSTFVEAQQHIKQDYYLDSDAHNFNHSHDTLYANKFSGLSSNTAEQNDAFDDVVVQLENEKEERHRVEEELEAETHKNSELTRMWQIAQDQVQFLQSSLSKAHISVQYWTRRAHSAEKELRGKRKEIENLEKQVNILKEALRRQGRKSDVSDAHHLYIQQSRRDYEENDIHSSFANLKLN
jgi:flagellar biosynthesis chaperone FliJ